MKNARRKRSLPIVRILMAAAGLLSVVAISLPSAAAASALLPRDQCDAEAGSEHDGQRNTAFRPVATDDIRIGIALSACREAYNQGSDARQTFQLARVLHKAGQKTQAMALLKEAAEAGHALAMVNYAVMRGEQGDTATEFSLYQQAAAAGNILAAYNLGVAYRDGVGTAVSGSLAARWFERASVARDPVAAFNLAVLLDEGKLLPEDNAAAARHYRIAADRGNVDAMINLGLMLETGEGISRDIDAALALYDEAARNGDVFGRQKLTELSRATVAANEQVGLALPKSSRVK